MRPLVRGRQVAGGQSTGYGLASLTLLLLQLLAQLVQECQEQQEGLPRRSAGACWARHRRDWGTGIWLPVPATVTRLGEQRAPAWR